MAREADSSGAVLKGANPFRLTDISSLETSLSGSRRLLQLAEKVIGLDAMARGYEELEPSNSPEQFAKSALDYLDLSHEIAGGDLNAIPKTGSVLLVANHPFGGVEGLMLLHLLRRLRPDVKIMANSLLKRVPEVADAFIGVNPYGGDTATKENFKSMRESVRWLKEGGLLVVFPAGDVASLQLRNMRIVEGEWDPMIARLARIGDTIVVPLFIEGKNSHAFNVLGKLHPRVRTVMLPREMLNKTGHTMRLWVGEPLAGLRLKRLGSNEEIAGYLRLRSRMLGSQPDTLSKGVLADPAVYDQSGATKKRVIEPLKGQDPIIGAASLDLLQHDIDRLPEAQKLTSNSNMDVFYAEASQIPTVLQEIGRLRELTFRAAGEGTGRSIDLDHYDEFYLHMFIWDHRAQQLVGAYRLGLSDKILQAKGAKGFYSCSLFKYHSMFLTTLTPAIELGRSFVREDYQRNVAPLMLLWKGIGAFVVQNPHYATLFGPVSISNDYNSVSQQLMIDFLKANDSSHPLRKYIRPRKPYRGRLRPLWRKADLAGLGSIDGISELVSILENDGKGAPVLMRHYLNIGGRMLGFNVDQQFGNCIDGLVVVDLRKSNRRVLNRYMGPDGANRFLEYHSQPLPLAS